MHVAHVNRLVTGLRNHLYVPLCFCLGDPAGRDQILSSAYDFERRSQSGIDARKNSTGQAMLSSCIKRQDTDQMGNNCCSQAGDGKAPQNIKRKRGERESAW